MRHFLTVCVFTLGFFGSALGSGPPDESHPPEEIDCYAAASLTEALTEAGKLFEAQEGSNVRFNFGASSMLARQIENGAPADLFFSADEEKMNRLQSRELILKDSRKSILSNVLVIVTSVNSKVRLGSAKDLAKTSGRIALAEFNSVPAGIYARQYLAKIGIWEQLKERIVPVQNVRAALSAVESENVEYAFVFKTDAQISKKVTLAFEIPGQEAPEISYPVAVLKQSKNLDRAKQFFDFLISPQGLEIFRKYGFLTPTKSRSQGSHLPRN